DASRVVGKKDVVLPDDHPRDRRRDVERDKGHGELQEDAAPVDRVADRLRAELAAKRPSSTQGNGWSGGFVAHFGAVPRCHRHTARHTTVIRSPWRPGEEIVFASWAFRRKRISVCGAR